MAALRRNKAIKEVQVYGKETVFISSLGPAAKLQFRQGTKEEPLCKHLRWPCPDQRGWLRFYCLQMGDWAPEHDVHAISGLTAGASHHRPEAPAVTSAIQDMHARCRARPCGLLARRVCDWETQDDSHKGNTVGPLWRH